MNYLIPDQWKQKIDPPHVHLQDWVMWAGYRKSNTVPLCMILLPDKPSITRL
jgi:hypothetical protein